MARATLRGVTPRATPMHGVKRDERRPRGAVGHDGAIGRVARGLRGRYGQAGRADVLRKRLDACAAPAAGTPDVPSILIAIVATSTI